MVFAERQGDALLLAAGQPEWGPLQQGHHAKLGRPVMGASVGLIDELAPPDSPFGPGSRPYRYSGR